MLRLVGSRRARDREHEPVPDRSTPDPPDWLDAVARAAWDETMPLLAQRRTVTRVDRLALARYCVMFSHWREAQEFVARHGKTYAVNDDEGKLRIMRRNPYVDIAAEAARQLGRLEAEFGMTPASRPRVPVSIDDRDDSLARFIAEGRRNSHAG